jgi:hypothetical protein
MPLGRAKFAVVLLLVSLACVVPPLLARRKDKGTPPSGAGDQRRAVHALNRLTFGPRPGDVQRVMALGVDKWIDLQLHPDKIDDGALDARLEPFRTLRMNTKELAENFPDGQEINQVMNGKKAMPSDAALRMIYQVQIARQQEKKERKQETGKTTDSPGSDRANNAAASGSTPSIAAENANGAADNSAMNGAMSPKAAGNDSGADASMKAAPASDEAMAPAAPPAKLTPEEEEQARRREEQLYADLDVQQLPSIPPDQRYKKVLGMSPAAQFAFADSLRGGKGQEFVEGLPPKQKETLLAMNNPAGVVTGELAQAKLLRAIYSERQLEEVMTDFWFNHFNVFVDKGVDRLFVTTYEREVIRPHVLGKFEDLLVATAKSPAMLF